MLILWPLGKYRGCAPGHLQEGLFIGEIQQFIFRLEANLGIRKKIDVFDAEIAEQVSGLFVQA